MKSKTIGYGVLMPVAPRCVITGERLGRLVLDAIQDRLPRFGDSSDMWIDDADRAQRCWEAAEDGCEGSTHAELIQDQRDGAHGLLRYGIARDCVNIYLDGVEQWHRANGSLYQQVG